eukprot:TRINITY_DN3521_c0_g1_i1.p1 TRINITY_DN3521_c0_g1~~TRINITY_DN3521_c0_g1_i1.p1  ORF type:complete len:950 (+),score=163.57 TRINITY_DN3521_c0_g1_i1:163-3012(+)
MSGLEVLAGIGLAATEVFRYNRENYEFDQDQRFEREELRIKMQVERFALFREDLEDLVNLTVSKMDLYHFVGALFIKQIVIYYSEGFFEKPPPVFLVCFYYFSQACAMIYLIMAVWLAMHASVCSHSYGTRLRTRFLRLPIPGSKQMNVLNARYADFERQGAQMLRVPFLKQNNAWQQRVELESGKGVHQKVVGDELGEGEFGYGGNTDLLGHEDELLHAAEIRTHRHVQKFRELQARWQCYDAYARVCMALGVRQMLQVVSYYMIGTCCVMSNTPHVAWVVVFTFQALSTCIATLDIHGVADMSIIGTLPALCALLATGFAERTSSGLLVDDQTYLISLAMYPLEVCWFELLYWLASPHDESGSLPRQFRVVLFMDVYSDIDEDHENYGFIKEEPEALEAKVATVQKALDVANSALRRWEAVPSMWMSTRQRRERKEMRESFDKTVELFAKFCTRQELDEPFEDERDWKELQSKDIAMDSFAGTVLGPFTHWTSLGTSSQYYWDIEKRAGISGQGGPEFLHAKPEDHKILSSQDALGACKDFRRKFDSIFQGRPNGNVVAQASDSEESTEEELKPLASSPRGSDSDSSKRKKDPDTEPVRLPWRLVAFLTRVLQCIWIGLGVIALLRETGTEVYDFQSAFISERRLTSQVAELSFEILDVDWPYGDFFRAESLSCPPLSRIFVGSPFAQYAFDPEASILDSHDEGKVERALQELSSREIPSSARMACDSHGIQCMTVEWVGDQLQLRAFNQSAEDDAYSFRLDKASGLPSRLDSGALVECSALGWSSRGGRSDGTSCLLVAGLGARSFEVTLLAAELSPQAKDGRDRSANLLREVKLDLSSGHGTDATSSEAVLAVHIDSQDGHLWALRSTGRLEEWDVLNGSPKQTASWNLRWPHAMKLNGTVSGSTVFTASAICKSSAGRFLLAGRVAASGRPVLLQQVSPSALGF